jgi:hypothetical protein
VDFTGAVDIANAYERDVDASTAVEEAALSAMGAFPELNGEAGHNVAEAVQQPPASAAGDHDDDMAGMAPLAAEPLANRPCVAHVDEQPMSEELVTGSGARDATGDGAVGARYGLPESRGAGGADARMELTEIAQPQQQGRDAVNYGREDVMHESSTPESQEVMAILRGIAELKNPEEVESAKRAVEVVEQILTNALREPQNSKFCSVRRGNKVFSSCVVPFPQVELLMHLAGFVLKGTTWTLEHRNDATMLQLVHSKLQQWAPWLGERMKSG